MKKILFTSLLGLGLLLPATFSAAEKSTSSVTEYANKNPKKKTTKAKKSKSSKSSKSYAKSRSKECTYNGRQLYVGVRGGCYYKSGNSRTYVDRAYCSGCN